MRFSVRDKGRERPLTMVAALLDMNAVTLVIEPLPAGGVAVVRKGRVVSGEGWDSHLVDGLPTQALY